MIELKKEFVIISGGQTGVDRAALDYALANNIQCGGWCPSKRIAEDGRIPSKYPLKETSSESYKLRTKKNILDSDGTLIIYEKKLDKGTEFTIDKCYFYNKPCYILHTDHKHLKDEFEEWLTSHSIVTLNVAGSRESSEPGIYKKAFILLEILFHKKSP